jgi:hypothetical protein
MTITRERLEELLGQNGFQRGAASTDPKQEDQSDFWNDGKAHRVVQFPVRPGWLTRPWVTEDMKEEEEKKFRAKDGTVRYITADGLDVELTYAEMENELDREVSLQDLAIDPEGILRR